MINHLPSSSESNGQSALTIESFDFGMIPFFRRHLVVLLGSIGLGIAASAAYFLLTSPTYESTSQILLLPKDASLAARGVDGNKDQPATLSQDMLATHMMLVQSPRIVQAALLTDKLNELTSLVEESKKLNEEFVDELSAMTQYVINHLYVTRAGKGQSKAAQIVKIAFRHSHADDAKQVVNSVVREFERFLNEKFRDVNTEAANIIERARENLHGSLNVAETQLRQFKEANPILFRGDQSTNSYRLQYEQLQEALTELRLERSRQSSRLALVEKRLKEIDERKGTDLERLALIDENNAERVGIFLQVFSGDAQTAQFQALQPARLEAARSEFETFTNLKAQELDLQADYGPDHPELKLVREKIAAVERFLSEKREGLEFSKKESLIDPKELVSSYISLLRHDIEASLEREAQLKIQSEVAEEKAKSLIKFELQGEALRLDATRQRQLYEAAIDRLTEIGMARDYAGVINEVIQEAQPGKEVWPKLSICGLIGSFAGLLLGLAGAGYSEWKNRELRSRGEIERITDAPILSQIPRVVPTRAEITRIHKTESKVDPSILAFHSPQSATAEIFRGLRTTLFFRVKEMNAKTIAVTSALSGDGKSTVTANLSVSIAQSGRKVLLIDCDLRKPSVARIFGVNPSTGLAELLEKKASKDETIIESEVPNLSLITHGSLPSNPAELLDSEGFKALVTELSRDYDFVFLDCPPVLAVSDPCIVGGAVDAVFVVLQLNPRSRPQVQKMMEMLHAVNANVMGTVLNASILDEDRTTSGGEKYGIGYGYGTHSSKTNAYLKVGGQAREAVRAKDR